MSIPCSNYIVKKDGTITGPGRLMMSGRSMGSTMMGVAHHYDSKGQLHVWDKNRQKVNIVCNECWKAGIVSNRKDSSVYEVEIIEVGDL